MAANREDILLRWRQKTVRQAVAVPTAAERANGVPRFLDQLVEALENRASSNGTMAETAALHGRALRLSGFTVSQVVHVYGGVCQAITDLAVETATGVPLPETKTAAG